MSRNRLIAVLAALAALSLSAAARAQTTVSEDFTGTSTTNGWYFFNGACLTAGSAAGVEPSGNSAGQMPGCIAIGRGGGGTRYYDESLVGGYNGVAGSGQTLPDPAGHGALRFTNGSWCTSPSSTSSPGTCTAYSGGFNQNGGVVSATPFPTGQGVEVTFKTVTYRGNSGGTGGDGAYGMSFFLMDASQLNVSTITSAASGDGNGLAAGGSGLGYTCSNANPPSSVNGLIGGYIGLGIDEYGSFLNGTANTLGESGSTSTGGDNTATGGGFKPGRIGIRGAGNVAWMTLTGAYGNNPNNAAAPYYPESLTQSCLNAGGLYNASTGACELCPSGATYNSSANQCAQCPAGVTYNAATNTCDSCPVGQTYEPTTNTCFGCVSGTYDPTTNTCTSCPSGQTYDPNTNTCQSCPSGATYNPGTNQCETCNGSYSNYDASTGVCEVCTSSAPSWTGAGSNECCPNGYTWSMTSGKCRSGTIRVAGVTPTTATPTTSTPSPGPLNQPTSNPPNPPISTRPTGANPDSYYAVQNTCRSGNLWNYSAANNPTLAGAASLSNPANTGLSGIAPILDYAAIPGAYAVLPAGAQIATEGAMSRGAATPILYDLTITQNGLLSLSYSINGGAYQQVIKSQSIAASNGPLPANFLFGFAGATGGSSNLHEILCFKAVPPTATTTSSAGSSERQSARLETGAQAFFAYYNPRGWTGRLTANALGLDQFGNVIVANTATWDASCVLSGVQTGDTCAGTGVSGPAAAQAPASRVMLTWSGKQGIPFEYNNLSNALKSVIDAGDNPSANCNAANEYDPGDRVAFLRGDRSCEINSQGIGLFRARDSVLADIVDSSPAWVGPPVAPYPAAWNDRLYATATNAEDASGAQTYVQYVAANETRLNVAYAGANDGFVHGFRTGSYNSNGTFCSTASNCSGAVTPNDGQEVLAYMPGAVLQSIHNAANAGVDYSSSQYGHQFLVDATPGTGDLFYNNAWHSWVVGGLGPGGAAIYALDVTNPANFAESNAASLVIGEWTPTTISCTGTTTTNGGANCGNNLGNTYGTPSIRRLHNGDWAMIFGNGLGSASGDAGVYIMTVDPNTSSTTFYYLSTATGSAASPNGIAYASPVDLDGDHITDYVYAGDLQGNLWRFDLTSNNPSNWQVTPGPVFKTPAGQPITTAVLAASGAPYSGMAQYLMLLFGTGQKVPLTNLNPATYASGAQALYGVWDWNLTNWNTLSRVQYAALAPAAAAGLSGGNQTVLPSNLQAQTVTIDASTGNRDVMSNQTICWFGTTTCAGANSAYGWYISLPGSGEQVVYNPELVQQAITLNSIVPASNDPTSCALPLDTGFTYVLSVMTGAAFRQVFLPPAEAANPIVNTNPAYLDANAIAMQTNATGSSVITGNASGTMYLIYETNQVRGGAGANSAIASGTLGLNLPPNTTGRRISWIERR